MADISMCSGGDCPRKDQCYRFTATPSEWQSWSDFYQSGEVCTDFSDNAGRADVPFKTGESGE